MNPSSRQALGREKDADQTRGSFHALERPYDCRRNSFSPTSVHRYFKLLCLQPHRSESFRLSTDPFFIEKLRHVFRLYLSPSENTLVLCVDEKSQCQAIERTQSMLPMSFGYVEGITHDYVRHGNTTLLAAPTVLNGAVIATCNPRHRHQEFLSFLGEIDKAAPTELDVHGIVGNYGSLKNPKVGTAGCNASVPSAWARCAPSKTPYSSAGGSFSGATGSVTPNLSRNPCIWLVVRTLSHSSAITEDGEVRLRPA